MAIDLFIINKTWSAFLDIKWGAASQNNGALPSVTAMANEYRYAY